MEISPQLIAKKAAPAAATETSKQLLKQLSRRYTFRHMPFGYLKNVQPWKSAAVREAAPSSAQDAVQHIDADFDSAWRVLESERMTNLWLRLKP